VLGQYGPLTLEGARDKADEWLKLIRKGIDPAEQAKREREGEEQVKRQRQARDQNTFEVMAEDFLAEKVATERGEKEVTRDVRRIFIKAWRTLPVAEITDAHVATLIKSKRATPTRARRLFALLKRMFRWALAQRDKGRYGLSSSPCATIDIDALIGKSVKPPKRVLSDSELRALWLATDSVGEPYGSIYRLLMLSGLRLNEVADARWREIDLDARLWTIPAERMKGEDAGKRQAQEHEVPLTDAMLAVLEKVPLYKSGDYLFSMTFGKTPVWVGDKVKKKINDLMGNPPRWKNHHIRHAVRTRLSKLKVRSEVAEAILAHRLPGMEGVYNSDDFRDEKRAALVEWASWLRAIVEPPPSSGNVVKLQARG
jgi:integrase